MQCDDDALYLISSHVVQCRHSIVDQLFFYGEIGLNGCTNSIQLVEDSKREISPVFLKKHVMLSLKQLFGEIGAKSKVDLIKYNLSERKFVLRCKTEDYVRLRAALTLASSYEGINCFYDVERATQNPLSLTADSRTFLH